MNCTCGRLAVGLEVTENRNWEPTCPEHGIESVWWNSDEEVAARAARNARLKELYVLAREARKKRGQAS
jgi:hypothetical protein